jgi:hypothetical protein
VATIGRVSAGAGWRAGLCVVALVALVACSSDEGLAHPPTSPRIAATDAPATGALAPASGVLTPASGAPAWCATLSASPALTGLPDAFRALADPSTADSARGVLAAAAADLQAIVPQTTRAVTDAKNAVISSLNAVAANGLADADATSTLSSNMIAFGNEVQTVCQFALDG